MTDINKNNIRTNIWDSVYTYLQTTNAISTNNIFSAYNSTLAKTKNYPIVIIGPPRPSIEKLSIGGDYVTSDINMTIEVYDNNAQDTKSLADEVVAKLLAGRKTFASDRMMNMQIDGGDYDAWTEGSKKIHRITFDVSFRTVMT